MSQSLFHRNQSVIESIAPGNIDMLVGGTAVKFIDQNSEFDAPNHENYQGLYRTGFVTTADSPNEQTTLTHRWMGVAQTLPHKLVSQGVQPGDQLTISWNQ